MATASVPYQAATGREYADLTGWTGSALFTATPVSGDQIEGPDTLTYPTDGDPTGADGTYTLRLIQTDGSVEAVSYQIGIPAQTPQGTITLGTPTVDQTTISLPFTYNDTDQTGFEYRVDGGTWTATTSPVSLTGLTENTEYTIEVRAVNAEGGGTAASTALTTDPVPSSATATVTFQPETGRSFVTLTSWAGDASFAQTPVAGDQIEYPDALTVGVDGAITGADGSYTLRHLRANGTVEAISYTIGAVAQVPQGTITIGTATIGETTASIPFTYDLSDQNGFEYRLGAEAWASTTSPVTLSGLTAETAYTVEVRAVNATGSGTAASTSFTTDAVASEPSSATATVAYDAPAGKTDVTLATGFDDYIFQDWSTQPVIGEQIVFTESELTIDTLANVTTDNEGVFDVWFVASNGTVTATTIDTTGLASAGPDTTPDAFTVSPLTDQPLSQYVEFAPITVSGIDAGESIAVVVTGANVQYAVNSGSGYGGFTATSTNVQLGDLVKPRILTSDAFQTAATGSIAIGSESSSLSATTRAAVPPTVATPIPDLSAGQAEGVNLDLSTYFSGADSYSISGLASGTGLTLSGSTLAGNPTNEDVAASPATLTVTATNAEGSVQDSFAFTAVDDIGPNIMVYPLTTLDTAPIVSGSAGDASTLTLVVNGVTYTPTPSGGTWSQQLPTLALGDYTMTLNGEDASGNAATQAQATLSVVEEIVNTGRRIGFLKSARGSARASIRESIRS